MLFYRLSVFVHILAACVWVGGMVAYAVIVAPMARKLGDRRATARMLEQAALRFRPIGWTAVAILVLTGIFNVSARGWLHPALTTAAWWTAPPGSLLAVKLTAVLVMAVLSLVHDVWFGPAATAEMQRDPDSARAARLRRLGAWLGWGTLATALIAVAIGVLLVRGLPG